MLLLHGALDGTDLLLWGEPFSDPAADVVRHVGQPAQAIDAAALEAELEHAFGELAGSRTPIDARMGGCTVPALRLDPPGAIALLARAHEHQSLLAPGLVADAALRVLARLARHAAAAVVRQELVPHLRRRTGGDDWQARWELLLAPDARDALRDSAHGLPASALALTTGAPATDADLLRIDDILRDVRALAFAGACADAFVRRRLLEAPVELVGAAGTSLHDRWLRALTRDRAHVDGPDDALERLSDEFAAWQLRLRRRVDSPFRLCFRLEEPTDVGDDDDAVGSSEGATWYLRFLVQSRADPSFLVALDDAWEPRGSDKATLRTLGFHAGEHLFAPLGEAAALADPIAASLQRPRPGGVECTTAEAHAFLSESAPLLEQAGFGVFVPAWWRGRGGRFQLSLRAKVTTELTGGRRNLDALNLETLVDYDWHLAIGDAELTDRELRDLAHQKTPLLHVRGQWVELDSGELRAAIAHVDRLLADPLTPARGGVRDGEAASIAQLVAMSVGAGGTGPGGLAISGVSATGDIGALLADLPTHDLVADLEPPAGLDAELRPYQLRGYRWLDAMARLGLGACLADDMGLGKTVQVLAAIQGAKERAAVDTSDTARAAHGPTLIACPTSVVTNWLRECQRFTPGLTVLVHHGPDRLTGDAFAQAVAPADGSPAADIVITSFALLARDEALLARIDWSRVVLDEAQNIKNPGTAHARAARALRAPIRIALTGTPVENHVGDLWSIMEFLNPGLLGTQRDFRRRYLLPIQAGDFPEVTARLRRLTAPFVLRRLKTDRTVIADLPDKFETVEYCTLTTEQVALYEAIIEDAKRVIRGPRLAGIDRRGMILATISKLKQVCNHPAQLLGDNSRIAGRSGKLARLEALLEQVLERGERALVFTQFVQMGELLRRQLHDTFGREVLLLHGGTSRKQRDAMVARFQDAGAGAPPILVLSLKAGGSGLNLTAATHVVHFDRWWNPATEQQATDRAFRIGQTRDVQVHALVCAGTVEEQVDRMLQQKRAVAEDVVGAGEQWITELGDDELLDLVQLRTDTLLQPGDLGHTGKQWGRATL